MYGDSSSLAKQKKDCELWNSGKSKYNLNENIYSLLNEALKIMNSLFTYPTMIFSEVFKFSRTMQRGTVCILRAPNTKIIAIQLVSLRILRIITI